MCHDERAQFMRPEKRARGHLMATAPPSFKFPHNHLAGDLHELGAAGVSSPHFPIVAVLGLIIPCRSRRLKPF